MISNLIGDIMHTTEPYYANTDFKISLHCARRHTCTQVIINEGKNIVASIFDVV